VVREMEFSGSAFLPGAREKRKGFLEARANFIDLSIFRD
jgi:hypothetical protein